MDFSRWKSTCVKEASEKLKFPGLSDDARHQLRILSYDIDPSNPEQLRWAIEVHSEQKYQTFWVF